MTKDEFRVLAKGLKAVYTQPNFLPDAEAIQIWYELLKDLDYATANVAIQKHMVSSKYPPTIADIREQATEVSYGQAPLWSDGWEQVLRAMRLYGSYRLQEALDSMDDLTRKAVKRLGFKELCISENIAVDRANFRMVFEQLANREYEIKKLPLSLQNSIEDIQHSLEYKRMQQLLMKGIEE